MVISIFSKKNFTYHKLPTKSNSPSLPIRHKDLAKVVHNFKLANITVKDDDFWSWAWEMFGPTSWGYQGYQVDKRTRDVINKFINKK